MCTNQNVFSFKAIALNSGKINSMNMEMNAEVDPQPVMPDTEFNNTNMDVGVYIDKDKDEDEGEDEGEEAGHGERGVLAIARRAESARVSPGSPTWRPWPERWA